MEGSGTLTLDISKHNCRNHDNDGSCPFNHRRCIFITVADTGKGIPDEILPNIFKEGFSTKNRGNGIGLPAVRRIIEEHNGEIDVQTQPGNGTRFRIILPRDNNFNGNGHKSPEQSIPNQAK